MDSNPWEEVIDELYEMGGYGELQSRADEHDIQPDLNLVLRTGLGKEELNDVVERLETTGLVNKSSKEHQEVFQGGDGKRKIRSVFYSGVALTEDGFGLAHDRRAEKRNHESNRSIIILTFVLAVVGLSQATALTIQSGSTFALGVLAGAAIVLLAVYIRLYQKGIIDF